MKKTLLFSIIFIISVCSPSFPDTNPRRSNVVIAVEKISPAVVNISSEMDVYNHGNPFSQGMNKRFQDFFNDFLDPQFRSNSKRISLGSGVIIDGARGYILTNAHVIEKTSHITVSLNNKREYKAQLVGADPESDLAVLKINSKESLPAVTMGNSDDIMIGETIIAIGNPFGFSNTVTTGVVSALNRSIKSENRIYKNFIQIDAPINPGNSGGPLLNILGDLIGINTAIYANAQGIGFAIPINRAKSIISNLIKYGEVIHPWTGLDIQNIDRDIVEYLGLKNREGVVVTDVYEKSPAYEAGFRKWDVIIASGNDKIRSTDDFDMIVKSHVAGDQLRFNVYRKGKFMDMQLATIPFPPEMADHLGLKLLGIKVNRKNSKPGVSITDINKGSYLYRIGVRPGDQICQINESKINDHEDYKKALIKYRYNNSMILLIVRNGYGYYITIQF